MRTISTLATLSPVKACVRNGRLVLDEPTDLPEGTEVELMPVIDDLSDEERAAIDADIALDEADEAAGRPHYTWPEVLAELKKIP